MDEAGDEEATCRYLGRTRYDAPESMMRWNSPGTTSHQPGDIVFVNVTDSSEYDLYGEEVSSQNLPNKLTVLRIIMVPFFHCSLHGKNGSLWHLRCLSSRR